MSSKPSPVSKSNKSDPKVLEEVYRLEKERFEVPADPDAPFLKEQVVYGKGGEKDLEATLYLPKSRAASRPGVVYIHGGGWRGGSRSQYPRHAAAMAGKGYVGLCINYRLSGEAPYPAAMRTESREHR